MIVDKERSTGMEGQAKACDKGRVFRQEARGASGQASRKNRERI